MGIREPGSGQRNSLAGGGGARARWRNSRRRRAGVHSARVTGARLGWSLKAGVTTVVSTGREESQEGFPTS